MKRITKQIFSVALCVVLLLSMLPAWALGVSDESAELLNNADVVAEGEYLIGEGTLEFVSQFVSSEGIFINFTASSDGTVTIDLLELEYDYHVIVYENDWWLDSFNGTDAPDSIEFPVQADGQYNVIFSVVEYHTEALDAWLPVAGSLTYRMTSDVPVSDITQWPHEDPRKTLEDAYALEDGMGLGYGVTLTGEITSVEMPYDPYYHNITVVMTVPGCEDLPILCYRLAGEGVDNLAIGDTITVSGYIWNYRGTIEFEQGCTLDGFVKGDNEAPIPPEDPLELVDAAYALAPGEKLPYISILTGEIISIDTPYSEDFHNITVTIVIEGRETKPIVCYRLKGDGVEFLAEGDIITVKGILQNYAKYGEGGDLLYTTVEFEQGSQLLDGPTETIQLYCRAPWEQCYVYTWDAYTCQEYSGNWPGTLMTDEGNGLWSCEVKAGAVCLIFNSGNGQQTCDLYVPADDQILYVVESAEWTELYGPEPDDWGPDSLTIVGMGLSGIDAWNPADMAGDMVEVAPDYYQLTLECPADSDLSFKFVGNHMWDDAWNFGGTNLALGQQIDLDCGSGSQDLYLYVEEDCTLQFTVDLSPMRSGGNATLLVDVVNPIDQTRSLTVFAPESWLKAYAYTWEPCTFGDYPGKELQELDGYYWDAISSTMVNLIIAGERADGTMQQTDNILLQTGGDPVTLVINNDGTYTIRYGDGPSIDGTYRVVGNADWMGNWDCASDEGLMYLVDDGVYQKCFENVQPGAYEFKITVNGIWDNAIGSFGDSNFAFNVTETSDVYVTYYEQTGEVDIYVENSDDYWALDSLALVGSGFPGISEWNPADPAGDMIEVAPNVYEKILDIPAGTSLVFRIVGNDSWDGGWFMGGMAHLELGQEIPLGDAWESDDITLDILEDCTLRFTVDLNGLRNGDVATLLAEKVDEPVSSRKLTVYVPDAWEYVNIYTWDPEAFGSWPGARIQKNGECYQAAISGTMTNLVINGTDDLANHYQTSDIYLEANGKDVIVTVHEDGSHTVEYDDDVLNTRPLSVVVPSSWSDVCIYTWEPESFGTYPGLQLQKEQDGIYRANISSELVNLVISGTLADGTRWQTDVIYLQPGYREAIVFLREDFTYSIVYDNTPIPGVDVFRVVGSTDWMGLWDPASDKGLMEETSDGVYQKRFENVQPGSYEFKITRSGKWDDAIGDSNGNNFTFSVSQVSDVVVTCAFDAGDLIVSIDIYHLNLGDVTGDGQVNLGDVARLYAHARGTKPLMDATALRNADYNCDGKVNIGDVAGVYTHVRWSVTELPEIVLP